MTLKVNKIYIFHKKINTKYKFDFKMLTKKTLGVSSDPTMSLLLLQTTIGFVALGLRGNKKRKALLVIRPRGPGEISSKLY